MRKILVSLLVVSMLLGLVGTASAAAFSDTAGNKYIDKVAAYGWMVGDAGTTDFRPSGNITRAEAAKVIVVALGLNAAADAATGLGSKFSDVPATHWAAGYINVCTSKNIIKGCGDGTFQPSANVTNAEMITMIIRALNREALAVGDWPVGHITAAVDAGIIGTGFVANIPATREMVATYMAKASTKAFYKLTGDGWIVDDDRSFVQLCDYERTEDSATLEAFDSTTVTVDDIDYDLAADFRVSTGKELKDMIGYKVFVTTNGDGEAVLLEIDADYTIVTGDVDYTVDNDYLYLADSTTKYTMADSYDVYINGVIESSDVLTDVAEDDTVELHLNADDEVTMIKKTDYQVTNKEVTAIYASGSSSTWSLTANSVTYGIASDAIIVKNGVTVPFTSIVKGDIVNIGESDSSTIKYLEASDKTVAGKVTGHRTVSTSTATAYYVSIDGVEYRGLSAAAIEDAATGYEIEATLCVNGRIFSVDVTTTTSLYGKVVSYSTSTGGYDSWVVKINGVDKTYEVAKVDDESIHDDLNEDIDPGDYVKLDIDNNGRIGEDTELIDTFEAKVEDAAYQKVTKVYTSDKLIAVADIYSDAEADPDDNRDAVSTTHYTVPDNAVVYANGSYAGSGISAVPEGSFVQFVLDSTGAKIEFMLIDSTTTCVTGKISVDEDSINGDEDSVTAGATLYAYDTANMTGMPISTATADDDGAFELLWPGNVYEDDDKAYVKVVEAYGNFTTFSKTRTEDAADDAGNLTGLVADLGALDPVFAGATYEYAADAVNADDEVVITPTCATADWIFWNVDTDDTTTETVVLSGSPATIDLEEGDNVITITVLENGKAPIQYTITVTRAED